ncbi:MAG: GatB/YqeY domain-containing protein [Gammaproteobacteria bacterium]|nr:GatB/YqeY domain-containing protein [Gammaproteobacteria bacterium]MCP5458022.1 GatB/YqeY domain-containing protein [Gammaproteobacteria bacterium]
MSLKERIQDDLKAAMRARDMDRVSVLRLIMAAIKQREVDERITLDDGAVIAVLERMIKQRRESIEQFRKGGREDLVQRESFEIDLVQAYLPQPLSAEEIDTLVTHAVAEAVAQSPRDMGKVMNIIKNQAQGRIDMAVVSRLVKERLSG